MALRGGGKTPHSSEGMVLRGGCKIPHSCEGIGFGEDTVEDCKISLENNDNVYFLLLHGTQGCVGANTWVSVPGTRGKLCQKARGATKIATKQICQHSLFN